MKEIENPYLKELVHQLPCTVQSKVDSTVKYYLQDGKGKNCSLEKLGKYELPTEQMHVELYLQDLIKDA